MGAQWGRLGTTVLPRSAIVSCAVRRTLPAIAALVVTKLGAARDRALGTNASARLGGLNYIGVWRDKRSGSCLKAIQADALAVDLTAVGVSVAGCALVRTLPCPLNWVLRQNRGSDVDPATRGKRCTRRGMARRC